MRRDGWHGVHGRVGDVLNLHGNAELPHPNGLVIRGGHELPALVDERDGVDWPQMIIVLLDSLACIAEGGGQGSQGAPAVAGFYASEEQQY